MHDARMRAFWKRCLTAPTPPPPPPRFRVLAHHAASVESKGGIYIAALRRSFQLAEIVVHKESAQSALPTDGASAGAAVWRLRTRNVARFGLRFVAHIMTAALLPSGGFVVDGQEGSPIPRRDLERIVEQDRARQERRAAAAAATATAATHAPVEDEEAELDICRDGAGVWSLCATAAPAAALRRDSSTSGSMRSVYNRPFVFVVGTFSPSAPGGAAVAATAPSQSVAQEHMRMAAFLSNLHAMAAETHVRVVRDADLLAMLSRPADAANAHAARAELQRLSPNLVLLGGPQSNAYARALASLPPSVWPAPVRFLAHTEPPSSSSPSSAGRAAGYAVSGAPCALGYAPLDLQLR